MTMGLLDVPGPLFGAVESALADFMPPILRLCLWAAFGAWMSIELYRLLSPQRRISAAAQDLRHAQTELAGFDGEFQDAMPLMGRMIRASGHRLLLVFPAAIAASLPMLALLVWLDGTCSARLPAPGEPVAVKAEPATLDARWQDGSVGQVVVTDQARQPVISAAVPAPVPTIHKWQWWNALVGNPAGYLPNEAPLERIDIDLPRIEVLNVGPGWVRGWEAPFFAVFMIFALFAKWARKVI
jgi:hypothetical protein